MAFAARNGFIVLTGNHRDFDDLHQLVQTTGGTHSGIFTVRYDNDRTRDMGPSAIAAAIEKIEKAKLETKNELFVLNHWRYRRKP